MNIQQLRYVVAIANNGTFREAASKLFVSQPSLSVSVKDLETELGFQIFRRTTAGTVLTSQGLLFYEKALEVVKCFDSLEKEFSQSALEPNEFSIASQHYDFLPALITVFSQKHAGHKVFRVFESTTMQILDEVAQGNSELGIIYLNAQNRQGLFQRMDKLALDYVELLSFTTHIYLSKNHPLAQRKALFLEDLQGLPAVRFTQEKEEYLYYSENFIDTSKSPHIYTVSDRATLNGILERTAAFATGSGFLDQQSVNGIKVIPLRDHMEHKMIYVKRRDKNLSAAALHFVTILQDYFEHRKEKQAIDNGT
ncbi:TPA: LysR family transcriptional regulator [Streptococcus equi subsp. zooepidemicus]|uniref:LysR family transcriptional regulator n=1 Tax=Streptococcus equi TaxID=1336 RepID=UPI001E45B734|nr:LysR family transcriptional regulator [Streptococcus equi]UFR18234.1 LysR family transcriptional regulator [Streptococcus equi subsp. zooepidemicus]WOK44995.1 LysR family transcriptional regulator [Streptococcus equi subsp. equi]WOK46866.1 LysR family transcriptional regulator [Streptococcus equi subsp. equi]WOK48769.1 LysR family transcriptional regulator [Streptococcus equi subsp. equi]HEL0008447.1 LysR family transcriptional regulator [Streptococcus equi subsp. zooepidemicus]